MGELFHKEVNICTKRENFWGSRELPQIHDKVCEENETKKQEKKPHARKNVIDGGEHFIGCLRKTGGND